MERLLLSKKEAANAIGVSVRTLENLLSLKELRSVRVGRRRLVPSREISRFCRGDHATQPASESAAQGSGPQTV